MNKTDRMLAILLEIQRMGTLRAEDLAGRFETSVRTIYRDMQALAEAGVPIIGAPGAGYSLMEGYFLPPISFSVDEAVALLVGADLVEQRFDREYGLKARTASGKIEAVLSEEARREAREIRETMKLPLTGEERMADSVRESIALLRSAILSRRKVRIDYAKAKPNEEEDGHSVRVVRPYGLALVFGSWVLVAYCELRREIRHFRVSRMKRLDDLEETFAFPPDFRLSGYVPGDDRKVEAKMLASFKIADRIRETNYFYIDVLEDVPEGLLVTMRVRRIEDVLRWVLGWGAEIVVLKPDELRRRVREEAVRLSGRYD